MEEDYSEDLKKIEEAEGELEDYSVTPPPDLVAFNELRSCADLFRMYKAGQLITAETGFQREVVWSKAAKTRFIDSLAKQLPIPSMCLSLDYKTGRRLMIDGLQRISSIIEFLNEDEHDWCLSNLQDIDERIAGKTPRLIKYEYPEIYSRIENLTIPVTVLRCDYSKKGHLSYLFTIFHRLNTGGTKLNNQEIRNCIFAGSFNKLLKDVVKNRLTRDLFGLEDDKPYRYAYEELFLRVYAFSENLDAYRGRLTKFLNDYMESRKDISESEVSEKKDRIGRAIFLLYNRILDGSPLQKQQSKALIEALLVGIYTNIDELEKLPEEILKEKYERLKRDENFSITSLSEGLAETVKVNARISKALEIFG